MAKLTSEQQKNETKLRKYSSQHLSKYDHTYSKALECNYKRKQISNVLQKAVKSFALKSKKNRRKI